MPRADGSDDLRHFRSLTAGVCEDAVDEGKTPVHAVQQIAGAVAVFGVGKKVGKKEECSRRAAALDPIDALRRE